MVLERLLAPFRSSNDRHKPVLDALYGTIMAQSRDPYFYTELKVPDTVDGRFDLLVMHCYLVVARLRDGDASDQELSQHLFDHMFRDMDHALRELGVGDMGIGKRIQKMASKFYGRGEAYDDALGAGDDGALRDAIGRNVFAATEPPEPAVTHLAAYLKTAKAHMTGQSLNDIRAGRVSFPRARDHG